MPSSLTLQTFQKEKKVNELFDSNNFDMAEENDENIESFSD